MTHVVVDSVKGHTLANSKVWLPGVATSSADAGLVCVLANSQLGSLIHSLAPSYVEFARSLKNSADMTTLAMDSCPVFINIHALETWLPFTNCKYEKETNCSLVKNLFSFHRVGG